MHNEKNYLEIYFENEFIPHRISRCEEISMTLKIEYFLDNEGHENTYLHFDIGWILSC